MAALVDGRVGGETTVLYGVARVARRVLAKTTTKTTPAPAFTARSPRSGASDHAGPDSASEIDGIGHGDCFQTPRSYSKYLCRVLQLKNVIYILS